MYLRLELWAYPGNVSIIYAQNVELRAKQNCYVEISRFNDFGVARQSTQKIFIYLDKDAFQHSLRQQKTRHAELQHQNHRQPRPPMQAASKDRNDANNDDNDETTDANRNFRTTHRK